MTGQSTVAPLTATGTTPTSVTTTLASVVPELTIKLDSLNLNRLLSRLLGVEIIAQWQNQMATGALVALGGCPAKARQMAALYFLFLYPSEQHDGE